MDRERVDPLNDETAAVSAAIDRELRHALEIKPSAGFNAQLHERLAVERRARVWLRWPMLAMAAGAVAAIVLAVVLLRSPAREARTASAPPAPIATAAPAPVESVVAGMPANVTKSAAHPAASTRDTGPETPLREVEVIVPHGEADAIKRFADDLNDSVASGRWVPILAGGTPNSAFYALPMAPTIEHLPMAGSYVSERE
jgi:hypothetical protein